MKKLEQKILDLIEDKDISEELCLKKIKYIFNLGVDKDYQDSRGRTFLISACLKNRRDVALFLLENNVDVNVKDRLEAAAITYASVIGNVDIVKALSEKGAFLDCSDIECKTPLIYACFNNNTEVIKYLVEKGVNLDSCDYSKRSAIFYTVMHGNKEMTELLLDKGAETGLVDKYNCDLFFYAKRETKQMLLDKERKTTKAKTDKRINFWSKIFSR